MNDVSLKAKISNISKDKNISAQAVLQNYLMNRFLYRLSKTEYREKFVIKGGMLIASMDGMCAERNAIANMITNGESKIDKVVVVLDDGSVGAPCGACREYMMQLDKDSGDIEILLDFSTRKTVKLIDLIPKWWRKSQFDSSVN